jgi:hypothetical protein
MFVKNFRLQGPISKIILGLRFAEKFFLFVKITASFCKNWIITSIQKTPIFGQKLAKFAENCYHNIDPWKKCFRKKSVEEFCTLAESKIYQAFFLQFSM